MSESANTNGRWDAALKIVAAVSAILTPLALSLGAWFFGGLQEELKQLRGRIEQLSVAIVRIEATDGSARLERRVEALEARLSEYPLLLDRVARLEKKP